MATPSDPTILVLGATGTTGGEVARQLISAGRRPRLLVRDLLKAKAFQDVADLVQGAIDKPAGLAEAMQGVDKLYLVSAGVEGPSLEVLAIDAAKAAGVRHVVKLSVMTAETPRIEFARWHARTEQHLRASGMAWTMLRPGNFHTNAIPMWALTVAAQGVFYQPTGSGKWASVDPVDIGAVAVKALTESGHEGKSYTLTGPESLDASGYAAMLGRVLGRTVTFVDVPIEAARAGMTGLGLDAAYLDAALELQSAMQNGDWDIRSPDVETVLGRPGIGFDAWAEQHRSAFEVEQPA